MARRRRIKEKGVQIAKSLFPVLKVVTPLVAFVSQLTLKDRTALGIGFTSATTGNQVKILVNIMLGRIFGTQPFKSQSVAGVVQTINFDNIINDWTKLGAYGIGYKLVGGVINKFSARAGLGGNLIPHTAKIGSLAKGSFAGGLLGSIFDAPENNNMLGSSPSTTSQLSVGTPVLKVTSSRTSYGSDSTQSGV